MIESGVQSTRDCSDEFPCSHCKFTIHFTEQENNDIRRRTDFNAQLVEGRTKNNALSNDFSRKQIEKKTVKISGKASLRRNNRKWSTKKATEFEPPQMCTAHKRRRWRAKEMKRKFKSEATSTLCVVLQALSLIRNVGKEMEREKSDLKHKQTQPSNGNSICVVFFLLVQTVFISWWLNMVKSSTNISHVRRIAHTHSTSLNRICQEVYCFSLSGCIQILNRGSDCDTQASHRFRISSIYLRCDFGFAVFIMQMCCILNIITAEPVKPSDNLRQFVVYFCLLSFFYCEIFSILVFCFVFPSLVLLKDFRYCCFSLLSFKQRRPDNSFECI